VGHFRENPDEHVLEAADAARGQGSGHFRENPDAAGVRVEDG